MISDEQIAYVADQCLLLFGGGRITVEGAQRREIMAWIRPAISEVGTAEYWNNYKTSNQSTVNDSWVVPFRLPVTIDPVTLEKQAVLTESPLVLPKNRGIVMVKGAEDYKPTTQERWNALKKSTLFKDFIEGPFYSPAPGKVFLFATCDDGIEDEEVLVWQSVANDATFTEGQVLLVYQRILPLMQVRFNIKPDMVTNNNPK